MKKKAMSSEQASFKKKSGHLNEEIFCAKFNAKHIPGTGKTDCILNGKNVSNKRGKRYQLTLYSRNSSLWNQLDENIAEKILNCIDVFPNTFSQYKENKRKYKEKLKEHMVELKEVLSDRNNLRIYLNFILRNGNEIDIFAIRDLEGKQHIFDAEQFIEVLTNNIYVVNSRKGRGPNGVAKQKVIFKAKPRNRKLNLIDNEIRKYTHYKRWLTILTAFSPSSEIPRLLPLLQKMIKKTAIIKGSIVTYDEWRSICDESYPSLNLEENIENTPINQPALAYGDIIPFMKQVDMKFN